MIEHHGGWIDHEATPLGTTPLLRTKNIWYATRALNPPHMIQKPNQKVFHLNAIIDNHIIAGSVVFSPAPQSGVLTEVARFEAQRILEQIVREEIAAGRV